MKTKTLISNLFIVIISILIALIFFEIYARKNSEKFLGYGWQNNNILVDKIKICNGSKKIAIFGDSFVEYYGENEINLGKLIQNKSNYSVCNFGLSGTRISDYINRFLTVNQSKLKFEKIIFFIYEGNDFNEYRYLKKDQTLNSLMINGEEILKYNSKNYKDRKFNLLKNFIKSNYSLNFIYREIYKKNFKKNNIDESFLKDIYLNDLFKEITFEVAIQNLNNTPLEIREKLSSGLYNTSWYELALRNPNYFNDIFNPNKSDFEKQKLIAFKHLDFINNVCANKNLDCKFVIIPADFNNFEIRKKRYEKIFQFNYNKYNGKPLIIKELLQNYKNVYYPDKTFIEKDYLVDDIHLNRRGNKKLAEFTMNILSKQF
tara:strand:+ start:1381 stop:2502 length:1122 start_codon:yes stop_codon:yes gene_type:complete